mmetsp:Transcript_61550/g.97192  ORF Transcript_61550/g.97192 Transcript_61550/m.97192 type:complete len:81 (+) Transcript_61550:166-408(+)
MQQMMKLEERAQTRGTCCSCLVGKTTVEDDAESPQYVYAASLQRWRPFIACFAQDGMVHRESSFIAMQVCLGGNKKVMIS